MKTPYENRQDLGFNTIFFEQASDPNYLMIIPL